MCLQACGVGFVEPSKLGCECYTVKGLGLSFFGFRIVFRFRLVRVRGLGFSILEIIRFRFQLLGFGV